MICRGMQGKSVLRQEMSMRVINRTRGILLAGKVRIAHTFLSRLKGLLGASGPAEGEGLWIVPCRGVHTFGMRTPIDVAFLNAEWVVVGVLSRLPPNRIGGFFRGARGVLELRAGTLEVTGTAPGDRLEIEAAPPLDTADRRLLHCPLALGLPEC